MNTVFKPYTPIIREHDVYLAFWHNHKIWIKQGNLDTEGRFYQKDSEKHHVRLTDGLGHVAPPLFLDGSRVWCRRKEDLDKAVELLMNHRQARINDLKAQVKKLENTFVGVEWV